MQTDQIEGVTPPIEIERKFLVEVIGEIPNGDATEITQVYLQSPTDETVRVRKRGKEGRYTFYHTIKKAYKLGQRIEIEKEITEEQYGQMLKMADPHRHPIVKTRTCFQYNARLFELDTFSMPSLEHPILEVEGAELTDNIDFPPFIRILKEVTDNPLYYNSNLAKKL